MSKLYHVTGENLHNTRRILGVPVIAHTGKVNSFARCMGGKLKSANSVQDAQQIMKANVSACGGVAGGKKRSWVRKDGKRMSA